MQIAPFLSCTSYNGISTGISGSIIGAYDFTSGSGLNVRYNLLYTTGSHFSSGILYGPNLPLVSVGITGANSSSFSGINSYRLGYQVSGDFGVLLDITQNGCSRTGSGISTILASNNSGTSSGFLVGIDEANQLFMTSSGYSKTLYYELKPRNLVYFNLSKQNNFDFGLYDPLTNLIISESIQLPTQSLLNTIYLGGITNYSSSFGPLTGFSGQINNGVLFNKPIGFTEASGCFECLYAISIGSGTAPVSNLIIPVITGYIFSGRNEAYYTGFTNSTGQIITSNGTIVNLVFPSGLTGTRQADETAIVLTGLSYRSVTGDTPIYFNKNLSEYDDFTLFDIQFNQSLVSGDVVEVYTYSGFNPRVNKTVNNFNYPNRFFTQIICDGLAETNNVDYFVLPDSTISGFFDDDILFYDHTTGASIISSFSGFWSRGKTLMSGGSYYPTQAQFNEVIDTGRIIITGLTGSLLPTYSDVYLNGQKLISGLQYKMIDDTVSGWFGGQAGLNVLVIDPSYISDAYVGFLYSPTGGLPTGIYDIEDSELTVLPNFKTFNRYWSQITGNTNLYQAITGISEQVWVNGIRQKQNGDYIKNFPCMGSSGISSDLGLSFNFFSNDTGYFNIQ